MTSARSNKPQDQRSELPPTEIPPVATERIEDGSTVVADPPKSVTRYVVKASDDGRPVLPLEKLSDGHYSYVPLGPFGVQVDRKVDTRPAVGRKDVLDVNIDGRWLFMMIENWPLTVSVGPEEVPVD